MSPVQRATAQAQTLLPQGRADRQTVAKALAMSERTMARRLAREGTTYKAIIDQTRRDLALSYLKLEPNKSITQIALDAGYESASSFSHAVRRWTGQTASELRKGMSSDGQITSCKCGPHGLSYLYRETVSQDRKGNQMTKQDKASKNALLDLVDSYAKARTEAKAAEKLEQALREQVVAQFDARGVNALSGLNYDVFRTVSVRETLDSKAVRLILTPAQIEAVTKKTSVQTLSVTARGEVVA